MTGLDERTRRELESHLLQMKAELEEMLGIKNGGDDIGKEMEEYDTNGMEHADYDSKEENVLESGEIDPDSSKEELEAQLEFVNEALQRMHEGTYGFCVACENQIDLNKLRQTPEASLCEGCE